MAGAAAATQAMLLRATAGEPAATADLVAVALVAGLFVLLVVIGGRLSPRALALAAGLPAGLGGIAISLPVVLELPGANLLFLGVLAFLSVFLAMRGALRPQPQPIGPRGTVGVLLGMAALTGLVLGLTSGSGPALDQWLPAVLGGALLLALGPLAGLLLPVALLPAPHADPTGGWQASGPVPDGPDIVLITVDTLRADHAADMAAVQRIADTGVAMAGQASSPWTLPSMASLMTGLEPHNHGAGRDRDGGFHGLPADRRTMAQVLAEAGWDTAATIENPFVGGAFGIPRGFARVIEVEPRAYAMPKAPLTDRSRLWEASLAAALGLLPPLADGADRHVAHVRTFLAQRRDRPLFMWVHLFDPHLPFRHAVQLDLGLGQRVSLATRVRVAEDEPPPDDLADLARAYAHEVAVTDRALVEILDLLGPPPDRGRILVFTADHGEEFGEHGGWEHGHSMYQELLAIPLVIDGIDGLQPGVAGLVDVAPTVLAAVGMPITDVDGRDLRRGPTAAVRSSAPLYGPPDQRAVRAGHRKGIDHGDGVVAYDLTADPAEQTPLPGDPVLQALLPPVFSPAQGNGQVDAATRSRLEALGYVE